MAIATLEACFDNPQVFTGVVKIRKGMAARLILACDDMASVEAWFHHFVLRIKLRCPPADPSRQKIVAACDEVLALTAAGARQRRAESRRYILLAFLLALAFAALVKYAAYLVGPSGITGR
jgi:farnesyl-diphosphate farnesyltransferase